MIGDQVVALRVSRPAGVIIGVLAIVLLDALVWGVMTTQMLSSAQGELASATQQRSDTTTDLAASQAEVARLTSDNGRLVAANAQLTSDKERLTANLAALDAQVAKEAQCIAALRANVTALEGITALARTNLGRIANGSAWARANDALVRAFTTAAREEIAERETEPHLWIVKGRAAVTTMQAQMTIVGETTSTIDAARAAASASVTLSTTTCRS